jgi:uncharacterized protein
MDRERIERIAQENMAQHRFGAREPGYILYHGRRTAQIAFELADLTGNAINRDLLYVGAWFHDIGRGAEAHNEAGARMVRALLDGVCAPDELDAIADLVLKHCLRENPAYGLEVKLLQDADLLDHIGPIALWRALYWSATHEETIGDALRSYHSEERARSRSWMRGALNFPVSVRIFDERTAFEETFYSALERVHRQGL